MNFKRTSNVRPWGKGQGSSCLLSPRKKTFETFWEPKWRRRLKRGIQITIVILHYRLVLEVSVHVTFSIEDVYVSSVDVVYSC